MKRRQLWDCSRGIVAPLAKKSNFESLIKELCCCFPTFSLYVLIFSVWKYPFFPIFLADLYAEHPQYIINKCAWYLMKLSEWFISRFVAKASHSSMWHSYVFMILYTINDNKIFPWLDPEDVISLVPRRCGRNFESIISKLIIQNSSLGCEITLRRMPENLTNEKSILFQVSTWCCQATSYY